MKQKSRFALGKIACATIAIASLVTSSARSAEAPAPATAAAAATAPVAAPAAGSGATLAGTASTGQGFAGNFGQLLSSQFNPGPGPMFGGAPQGLENIFGTCVQPEAYNPSTFQATNGILTTSAGQNFLSQLQQNPFALGDRYARDQGTGFVNDGFDPGPTCSGADTVEDSSKLACEALNQSYVKRVSASHALAVLVCKEQKVAQVPGILNCLSKQANKLEEFIGSIKQLFAEKFSQMKSYVVNLNTYIKDREQQEKQIDRLLDGDGKSPGIVQAENEIKALVENLFGGLGAIKGDVGGAGAIDNLEQQVVVVEGKRTSFERALKEKPVELMNQCFSERPAKGYRCEPGGPEVAMKEFMVCALRKAHMTGTDGVIDERNINPALKNNADQATKALGTLLDQVFAQQGAGVATNEQQQQAAQQAAQSGSPPAPPKTNPFAQNLGPEQLLAKYGSALSSLNKGKLDLRELFKTEITNCYSEGQRSADVDRKTVGGQLYRQELDLKSTERSLDTKISGIISDVSRNYTRALASLTGSGRYILNTSACANATARGKVDCVKRVGGTLKSILDGSAPESEMNIPIKAGTKAPGFPVACNGLSGCRQAFSALKQDLTQERERVKETILKKYVADANSSAQKLLTNMAEALRPSVQKLRSQLQALNSNLSILGATVNIPNLDGGDAKFEAEEGEEFAGLFKAPLNVKNLLAAAVDPKIPDISGNNFSEALSSIAKVAEDLGQKRSKIIEAFASLEARKQECIAQEKKNRFDAIKSVGDRLASCQPSQADCRNIGSVIGGLGSDISRIRVSGSGVGENSTAITRSDIQTLETSLDGYASQCRGVPAGGTGQQNGQEQFGARCTALANGFRRAVSDYVSFDSGRSISGSFDASGGGFYGSSNSGALIQAIQPAIEQTINTLINGSGGSSNQRSTGSGSSNATSGGTAGANGSGSQ